MSTIKKVEYTRPKRHLKHDAKRGTWTGYQVDIRINKKRKRPVFATKADAEEFLETHYKSSTFAAAGLKAAVRSTVTLAELLDKRLSEITNAKEIIRADRVFRTFRGIFDASPTVTDIRKAHFQTFINLRLADGILAQSVDREMTILSTAFKRASELFPLDLEDFEPPSIARPSYKKGKRRRRVITDTEKDQIVASIVNDRLPKEHAVRTSSRPTVALMFELAWMLGLRFSEVKNLLKTDFNASERSLRVVRWKTGTVDLLEFLPDRVVEILNSAILQNMKLFIFDLACSDHTFAAVIRDACESNGITYGRSELDGVTFHSTRHSFTSRLIQVTDMATAASFTGHSSKEMVDYYSHASTESKKKAMHQMYGLPAAGNLRQIYDQIREGKLDFEEFKKMLE